MGVINKQTGLQHFLHENNITIWCIQETHLQPKISFKVRGYQYVRSDRIGRSKGGILTLVRNNIDAIQTTTHMDASEFQVLNLKKKDFHMKLVNLYSPNDKALSRNALPLPCCWRLQQSFTELGICPHRQETGGSRELAG